MRLDAARQVTLGRWFTERTGVRFADRHGDAVHGGSVHQCLRWPTAGKDAFVKLADASHVGTFEAEAAGLEALRGAGALRVPRVDAVGVVDEAAVLALEWLDLSPTLEDRQAVQTHLGERLAMQHRVQAARFGWHRDNTIGATPQPNDEDDDWVCFYQRRRLGYMLELAASRALPGRVVDRGQVLVERCREFFTGYRPRPSLLHGDLWGGNWSALAGSGEPVVYDPAVYFGDREADIAFTHLFGGFGPAFYAAYHAAWPLDPGAPRRHALYNLYHVLNHHVLFGGGYGRQAERMVDELLADLG